MRTPIEAQLGQALMAVGRQHRDHQIARRQRCAQRALVEATDIVGQIADRVAGLFGPAVPHRDAAAFGQQMPQPGDRGKPRAAPVNPCHACLP
jgi:hypothetical protein